MSPPHNCSFSTPKSSSLKVTSTTSKSKTSSSQTPANMIRRGISTSERYSSGSKSLKQRLAKNPALAQKLHQMALPLSPLVQLTTGHVHPAFPRTVLQFWLLTNNQLEDLAQFYHQKTPSPWSLQYPCPVDWRSEAPLEEKRRKMGQFIGLRGCDTPILLKTEEEIAREARIASQLAADEEIWKRKNAPYPQSP